MINFDRNILLLQKANPSKLRLKRGYIILIAGGAIVAASLSMLGYYGMQLVAGIQDAERHRVEPGGSVEIRQVIANTTQGAYLVAFPDFAGGQAKVAIMGPANETIVEKEISPPIALELFATAGNGVYALTLSNPAAEALEAAVILGDREAIVNRAGASSALMTEIFSFLLIAGIAAIAAGAIITVLDRRRITKMKQFGDTSDLV